LVFGLGAQEIIAVDADGKSEVYVRTQFGLPFCIDWLMDGRLLIVSGQENLLLRPIARFDRLLVGSPFRMEWL